MGAWPPTACSSGPAVDRLKNAPIREVVRHQHRAAPAARSSFDKLEVLSIAPIIADALDAVFDDTCVSEIFGGENQA